MNYAQYLQQGGQALPSIEEQVASLVQAAMQGDQLANEQINQIIQAAEQGDPKAQQLAQLIQQVAQKLQGAQPEAMKCGGKVRAKIKKACGGKKLEEGDKIKKAKKGCPCTLHKVGGRLIEVDCNGIPVAKNGAILKFQNPSGPLGNVYVGYGSNFISTDPRHSYVGEKGNFGNLGDFDYYIDRNGGNKLYAKGKDGKIYMSENTFLDKFGGGDNFHNWAELSGDDLANALKYFTSDSQLAEDESGKLYKSREAASKPVTNQYGQTLQSDGTYAGLTYGQRNAAAVGMVGADGKTGMTVDERKAWMQGEGKDYLASLIGGLGFDIANYIGSAAQNRALFNAYKGYGAWKLTQEAAAANRLASEPAGAAGGASSSVVAGSGDGVSEQGAGSVPGASNSDGTNRFIRTATGVWKDAEGNIDWSRSVSPEEYKQARLAEIQTSYKNDRDLLRSTKTPYMNPGLWKEYWAKKRELNQQRRSARDLAKTAANDYRAAYNDYIYGQIGKTPSNGVDGPEVALQPSDKTINPYFQYSKGNFKQGGSLNYAQYALIGGIIFPPVARL